MKTQILLSMGIAVAACAPSAPAGQSMTIAEYASWCGAREGRVDPATWREWLERYKTAIDQWEAIQPPEDLRNYHLATLATWNVIAPIIETKDPARRFNEFELSDPAILTVEMLRSDDAGRLPADVRGQLIDSNCIEGA